MTLQSFEYIFVQKTAQSVYNAIDRQTAVAKAERAARYVAEHLDQLAVQYGTTDIFEIADQYTRSMLL